MDWDKLRIFHAVAEKGSLTHAGDVLHLSQSAVSRQIRALGLGLCKSAPWVKRLHFGHIPHWYHDGGPFQIGHSHAIGPDLGWTAVPCLAQPDGPIQDISPRYYRGTVASLLRKSLFTPNTLAPRGPPLHYHSPLGLS